MTPYVGVSRSADAIGNTPGLNERAATKVVSADELLEQQIEAAKQRMCAAPEREGKLAEWREMVRLIDQRSVHYRRFMARMAGLE